MQNLTDGDLALVAAAVATLRVHYRPFWHTVAAALRMEDGRIVTGVHLGATVGRMAICAEAVAVGRAVLEGGGRIVRAVAVRHPKPDEDGEIAVVSPCGGCRELFADHAPGAAIIVPGPDGLAIWSVPGLLPLPYQR
ncbi:MAG: cytidine deaminase [Acetobacteraceae bacterium]|nr:cytidine deaminase [Acetobacteraceae bacterium]